MSTVGVQEWKVLAVWCMVESPISITVRCPKRLQKVCASNSSNLQYLAYWNSILFLQYTCWFYGALFGTFILDLFHLNWASCSANSLSLSADIVKSDCRSSVSSHTFLFECTCKVTQSCYRVLILIKISRESSGISTVEMIPDTNYEMLEMKLMLMWKKLMNNKVK